jgi:hypothetical protein
MTPQNVAEVLQRHCAEQMVERLIDGEGEACFWLKVVSNHVASTGQTHHFGLTHTGTWAWEYADQNRIARSDNYVGYLPLLEITRSQVAHLLKSSVQSLGLPEPVALTFPLDEVVQTALRASQYWASLATAWLEADYPPNDAIAALLPWNPVIRRWRHERLKRLFDC